MFNFMDYDHDRAKVRTKYIKEMNKKTTLQDIGEALDSMILNEQAADSQYWNLDTKDEKVKAAEKDTTNMDYTWIGKFFGVRDPMKPCILILLIISYSVIG